MSLEPKPNPHARSESALEFYEQGISALKLGEMELALKWLSMAGEDSAATAVHACAHVELLRHLGRSDAALGAARTAVERYPASPEAWAILGLLLIEKGELSESKESYLKAIELDPLCFRAVNNLAVVLHRLGDLRAAEQKYRAALILSPESVELRLSFAALLGDLGRYSEALETVEAVLVETPRMPHAQLLASALEQGMGRHAEALMRIETALAVGPPEPEFEITRAKLLNQLGRFRESLEVSENVSGDVETLHVRALALQGLNRPDEAMAAFEAAETGSSKSAAVLADRGWLLAEIGQKIEAMAVLDEALRLQPNLTEALARRSYLTRCSEHNPYIERMTSIAGNPDARYQDRLLLSFALGQFYLDQSDGGEAFHWLEMGNRLKRSTIHYEWEADRRRFAEIMAIFSPETMSRLGGVGDSSTRPIFVFGMPRSGTSLVEQVLASHPMVFGMGEPIYLAEMAEAPGFLERIPELLPTELASLGRRYLALTSTDSVETPRLVDKMPWNFLYAGLISLILPGARMIHCRRDPLDTCLSCYSLLFSRGYEYAYDQTELGRFYRLYESLMAHWQKVLPTKAVLEVAYEKLVEDTEFEVRRILDFCSLPWDEACLRFYQTPRRVASASLNQVRSPIYRTSVGRAQQFIPWLKPLEAALGLGLQGQ